MSAPIVQVQNEASTLLGYFGGAAGILTMLIALVVWLVKGLGGRVIQKEDEEKLALRKELEEARKAERASSDTMNKLSNAIERLKDSVDELKKQLEHVEREREREVADLRAEYKTLLVDTETRLRQELQRAVGLSAPRRPAKGH